MEFPIHFEGCSVLRTKDVRGPWCGQPVHRVAWRNDGYKFSSKNFCTSAHDMSSLQPSHVAWRS